MECQSQRWGTGLENRGRESGGGVRFPDTPMLDIRYTARYNVAERYTVNQKDFNKKMNPLIRGIKSLELEIDVLKKAKLALVTEKVTGESIIKVGHLITWNNNEKNRGRVIELEVNDVFEEIEDLDQKDSSVNLWVVNVLKDGREGKKHKVYSWEYPKVVQGSAP